MHVLRVRNVNAAFAAGLALFRQPGVACIEPSRNGPVLRVREPVSTVYERPLECVLFDAARDANPFFHVMEALWILGGRRDVRFLTQFNKRMADYSDDGVSFAAAYGYRLRYHFGLDQLATAIQKLRKDPGSRQVVLSIWDPRRDLTQPSKDIPCNDTIKLEVREDGALHMIVFNRSNDMIWGTYGANAVQFAFLLEYLAASLGRKVGTYTQISSNFHVYLDKWEAFDTHTPAPDPYPHLYGHFPLMRDDQGQFDHELGKFLRSASGGQRNFPNSSPATRHFSEPFLAGVAVPMYLAWQERRAAHRGAGSWRVVEEQLASIQALDWRMACRAWVDRRR